MPNNHAPKLTPYTNSSILAQIWHGLWQKLITMPPRIFTLPLLLIILMVFTTQYDVAQWLNKDWMDVHIRNQGWLGIVLYIALVGILTAFGVPRQFCALLGGYVFGIIGGTILTTCGTGLGCFCTFGYARFLGKNWLDKKFSAKFHNLDTFLQQSPFLLTLCIRIVPLGSNFLTNIAAGISTLPAWPFLCGSLVGFTVQNGIFSLIGSGIHVEANFTRWMGMVLYGISLILSILIWQRWKKHQKASRHCSSMLTTAEPCPRGIPPQ